MASSAYEGRKLLNYSLYGVSPRTRSRLRNGYENITPLEVDKILEANGGGRTPRLDRKQIAQVRTLLNGISEARRLYSEERESSSLPSHAFRPSGFVEGVDDPDGEVWISDIASNPTLSDMEFDVTFEPEGVGYNSNAMFFTLEAWADSDFTDIVWVELDDFGKWRLSP